MINLESSWEQRLKGEFLKPYMVELINFLKDEKIKGKIIFPPSDEIFEAFNLTPFEQVKVVIIGQDPYHGNGEAHGLCFSVKPNIKVPPSLKNIFKELHSEFQFPIPNHGHLINWAKQGVLLLNAVLTVEKDKPASHRGKGWEQFTDRAIEILNQEKENLVFMLWGKDARNKGEKIDRTKHLVLESGHPSPFSAHLFKGNKHFSKCNDYLIKHSQITINWQIK